MNSHLSSEQVCRWIASESGPGVDQHLRGCQACQADLDQFQNALAGFRSSLEQAPVPPVRVRRAHQALPRWILATAALSILVAGPVYWNARQRAAEQAKADELLLERVSTSLSRAVPASMEPLILLISEKETE